MWHDGLTFKLQVKDISGKLLLLLKDFLKSRKQRVVLNGHGRFWEPSSFLVSINDLSNGLKSDPKLFADDTSLFSVIHDVNSSQIDLNEDLDKINNRHINGK